MRQQLEMVTGHDVATDDAELVAWCSCGWSWVVEPREAMVERAGGDELRAVETVRAAARRHVSCIRRARAVLAERWGLGEVGATLVGSINGQKETGR